MGTAMEVSDATFDTEVLQATEPVLVDFWGPSCPPCRMLGPVIEELAVENAGSAKVVKVNIHECPTVAGKFGIMSIPTLIIFKQGQIVEQLVGLQDKARLQGSLDEAKG